MNATAPVVSRTRSFSTVFLIELWERFGFYGMQALIVYYMVQRLGFDDVRANLVWSAAAALIYVAPAIGGLVGDGILGTRRTMLTGAAILAIGYGLITLPGANPTFLYFSLGVIVVGNGLFKPNAGNMVRKIYEGDDSRIDAAFTIYYMAVNIGSTASMLLTPKIKDWVNTAYQNEFGWHAAFGVCCIGLIVGLVIFFFLRAWVGHIGSEPDTRPFDWIKLLKVLVVSAVLAVVAAFILQHEQVARWFVILAAIALLAVFVYLIAASRHGERAGLIAAFILTLQTIFFFIFYQQMPTSLALFALRNTDFNWSVFGVHLYTWLPGQYQALNPIWIMILSPILAWIYTAAGRRGKDLSIASKFALGFAMVAAGYFVYGMAGNFVTEPGKASSWVLIWGYGLYSLGELLVSGLGLAMIARYVPARMGGFMMGAYYVGVGISQYLGGLVANFAAVPQNVTDPMQTLPIYTTLFTKLGWAGVACTVVAIAMVWPMKRLSAAHASHVASEAAAVPTVAAER
jgi:POT family proton-dependent oligopeptide transporter